MTAVEDEVILIGGFTTHNSGPTPTAVEKYSLAKREGWSTMKNAPTTINRHCTVMHNTSFLMVIGGNQNSQVNSNKH